MPRALRIVAKLLLVLLGALVFFYAVLVGYLYVHQREMEYPADRTAGGPAIAGLPIQDVRIKTPDGETLQAWYEPPRSKGMPVILYLHGNGGGLRNEKWRFLRMYLEGVGFLAISYRGYGMSTGTPTEHGLFTDGLAAYDWLRAHGFAASDIVIHGHSLGSGVATWLALRRPARALILESPFTAAVDVAAEGYPLFPVGWLMRDQFLNRERIGRVHIPLLIAHGDRDSVIPFEEGVKLYELANQPKVFVRMRGSDHSTMTRDGVYECYWEFLKLAHHGVCPAPMTR